MYDMTYTVCQHCMAPVSHRGSVIREGFSYHDRCHKCYVCSETDLQDAEIFKGVIFCRSCSKRIFEGCSTARHIKKHFSYKSCRSHSRHGRRRRECWEKRSEYYRSPREARLRELIAPDWRRSSYRSDLRLGDRRSKDEKIFSSSIEKVQMIHRYEEYRVQDLGGVLKKTSITNNDMGMITDVTQNLLKQLNCPVVEWPKKEGTRPDKNRGDEKQELYPEFQEKSSTNSSRPLSPVKIYKNTSRPISPVKTYPNTSRPISPVKIYTNTSRPVSHTKISTNTSKQTSPVARKRPADFSDNRIAEIDKSTELANMTVKRQSVSTSKITTKVKPDSSLSMVSSSRDMAAAGGQATSPHHSLEQSSPGDSSARRLLDMSLRSILRIPIAYFKHNIMERSSIVSLLMASTDESQLNIIQRLKLLLRDEPPPHHVRGIRRLYSTIHRRTTPYKLGWLSLTAPHVRKINSSQLSSTHRKSNSHLFQRKISAGFKCKHYRRSRSYRCLRAAVMRYAGPTKSQLALLRSKIIKMLLPRFIKNLAILAPLESVTVIDQSVSCSIADTGSKGLKTSMGSSSDIVRPHSMMASINLAKQERVF